MYKINQNSHTEEYEHLLPEDGSLWTHSTIGAGLSLFKDNIIQNEWFNFRLSWFIDFDLTDTDFNFGLLHVNSNNEVIEVVMSDIQHMSQREGHYYLSAVVKEEIKEGDRLAMAIKVGDKDWHLAPDTKFAKASVPMKGIEVDYVYFNLHSDPDIDITFANAIIDNQTDNWNYTGRFPKFGCLSLTSNIEERNETPIYPLTYTNRGITTIYIDGVEFSHPEFDYFNLVPRVWSQVNDMVYFPMYCPPSITIEIKKKLFSEMQEHNIHVDIAGTLEMIASGIDTQNTKSLTVFGNINAKDIAYIQENFKYLRKLDLSEATIENNTLTRGSFYDIRWLHEVYLPKNLKRIEENCFHQCYSLGGDLTTLEIPESLEEIGEGSFALIYVRSIVCKRNFPTRLNFNKENIEWLTERLPFNNYGTVYVPKGSKELYSQDENWNIHKIIEYDGDWIPLDSIKFEPSEITMKVGERIKVEPQFYPENTTQTDYNFTTSYQYVASDVYPEKEIIANRRGSAMFYAISGNKYAYLKVIVKGHPQSIIWEQEIGDLSIGESVELGAYTDSGLPFEYSITDLNHFILGNNDICEIVGNKFYAKSPGTILIIAQQYDFWDDYYEQAEPVIKKVRILPYQGDANGDNAFTVSDITFTVGHILGELSDYNTFFIEAADIDKDGEVLVNDLTAIVDIVLDAESAYSAPSRIVGENASSPADVFDLSIADGTLVVDAATDMAAAQFDVILPESARLDGIALADDLAGTHLLTWRQTDANRVRVVIYSLSNATMRAGELAELQISTGSDKTQNIGLTNALYDVIESDGHITESAAAGTWISVTPSGLGKLKKGMKVYANGEGIVIATDEPASVTLSNTLGESRSITVTPGTTHIPVPAGVYFINNQKLIVR